MPTTTQALSFEPCTMGTGKAIAVCFPGAGRAAHRVTFWVFPDGSLNCCGNTAPRDWRMQDRVALHDVAREALRAHLAVAA